MIFGRKPDMAENMDMTSFSWDFRRKLPDMAENVDMTSLYVIRQKNGYKIFDRKYGYERFYIQDCTEMTDFFAENCV